MRKRIRAMGQSLSEGDKFIYTYVCVCRKIKERTLKCIYIFSHHVDRERGIPFFLTTFPILPLLVKTSGVKSEGVTILDEMRKG